MSRIDLAAAEVMLLTDGKPKSLIAIPNISIVPLFNKFIPLGIRHVEVAWCHHPWLSKVYSKRFASI